MKKILITGGAGFIGSNFVHYWLENHPSDQLFVLDNLTYAGNLSNLDSVLGRDNFTFVQGSICDLNLVESLLQEYKIDTVVHFAAESHVDRSIYGPDAFIETNIMGTYTLLKAAKNIWIDQPNSNGFKSLPHRFHHVSTDEVYGTLEPNEPAFNEETAYAPNSPYSASKAASDHLVRAFHHTYGLEVTMSNCSNNYGPFHFPEKLIPLIIINLLTDQELPIYGDGLQVRDWLYVEDHAYGIDLILQYGEVGEKYNIGGNNEWANIDIVKIVCRLVEKEFLTNSKNKEKFTGAKSVIAKQSESLIRFVKDRPGHDRRYAIDAQKSESQLGYRPKESFESGILKTIRWYLDHDKWWQSVLDGTYMEWIKRQY